MHVVAKTITLREANQAFSRCIREVEAGEEFTITRNGEPVARLVPMDRSSDRIMELIATGRVTPARRRLKKLPERVKAKGTVSDLVSEDRG